MVSKLFGKSNDKKKAAVVKDPIETMKKLNNEVDSLNKKQEINKIRIKDCLKQALEAKKSKNMTKAVQCMKRKKMYEKENDKYDGMIMMMEQQKITLESMNLNQDVFAALKEATDVVKNNTKVDIEKFEDLKDDILEQQQNSEEINEFFKQNIDGEEDILNELNEIEAEGDLEKLDAKTVPTHSVTDKPDPIAVKPKPQAQTADIDLDALIGS
jgi:charged multivesicular body protein 4